MISKLIAVLLTPLLLNGCMMAGMTGMGHAGAATPARGAAGAPAESNMVKEMVAGDLRVTAEFPIFAPSDSLSYVVTIRRLDGPAIESDALVSLDVSPITTVGAASTSARFTPVERGGGRFVFRPSIPRHEGYRLAIAVERVGSTVMDPPIVLDYVVQPHSPATSLRQPGHAAPSGGLTPLVLLGAGLMAAMMLLAIR